MYKANEEKVRETTNKEITLAVTFEKFAFGWTINALNRSRRGDTRNVCYINMIC